MIAADDLDEDVTEMLTTIRAFAAYMAEVTDRRCHTISTRLLEALAVVVDGTVPDTEEHHPDGRTGRFFLCSCGELADTRGELTAHLRAHAKAGAA